MMKTLEYDYSKLDGKIKEVFGSRKRYSRAIGRSERTVSLKMNNKIPFDQEEIDRTVVVLNIPADEIWDYFFTRKVQ